jgi:hypothetical protein
MLIRRQDAEVAASAAAAAAAATASRAAPPRLTQQRAAAAAAGAAQQIQATAAAGPSVTSSGDSSDSEQMRAFDAGQLAPLQRQLTGTAHAASVSAAASSSGGSVPWGHPSRPGVPLGTSVSPAASLGAAPPVPVPGIHPAMPGRDLQPLWLMIHNPEAPPAYSPHYVWHPMRLVSTVLEMGIWSSNWRANAVCVLPQPPQNTPSQPPPTTSNHSQPPNQQNQIGNLPHAEITFRTPAGREHRALFMIDSGAGGADLLFHGRATREMGLVTEDEIAGRGDKSRVRSVRGVGGEGQSPIKVVLGELEWADWGGVRFEKVRGVVVAP